MFRKLILALGATVVIGAAALSPTTASAFGHGGHGGHGGHFGHGGRFGHFGHGGHWGRGFGFYAPTLIAAPDCYVVDRVVETRFGPRLRSFTVCN
jgi:hypothetical protein